MAIDYGEDLSCLDDLEDEMRVISDPKLLLAQALIRRWSTPRGMLLDDEDYGTDITEYINEDVDALALVRIRAEIRAEALKDERVVDCVVKTSSFNPTTQVLRLEMHVDANETTLRLVVAVSAVTVELLSVE